MILTHYIHKDRLNPTLLFALNIQRELWPNSNLETGTGWSGPKTYFYNAVTHGLRDFILSQLPIPSEIVGWGNYLKVGQQIGVHNHKAPGNIFSGVYYLTPSELDIYKDDETPIHRLKFYPGNLVVFTPEIRHSVPPVTQPHISIAFNAVKL